MSIEEKVVSIVRANTEEKDGVTLDSDLRKELRLDSFGTLMILNALEETYNIAVDEADFAQVNRVSDIVTLLSSKYGVGATCSVGGGIGQTPRPLTPALSPSDGERETTAGRPMNPAERTHQ